MNVIGSINIRKIIFHTNLDSESISSTTHLDPYEIYKFLFIIKHNLII